MSRMIPEVKPPHHGQYDDVAEDGHSIHLFSVVVNRFL